jgi:hypothetical protein
MSLRTRRNALRLLGLSAAALLVPRPARAAGDTTVVTALERNRTEVGEAVEFTVQVEREGEGDFEVPEPVLPDLAAMGLTIAGPPAAFRSTSSSFSFGTGRGSAIVSRTSQTYVYTLIPSKPGRFELPVHVMVDKTKVSAPRVPVLEVTGTAAPATPVAPGENTGPTEAQGDLFLWTRVDKPSVYVGEQLTYSLEVYERLPFPNIQLRQLPGFQDFWSEQLPEGTMRQEAVAGMAYRVHPGLRRALFPQRAGELTISPAEVGVGMRRRVKGRPVVITVKPLPAGAPAGFSPNNVGLYTIAAEIDRKTFKVGEPFTLTLTIRGRGNIRVLDPGTWPELPGLRRYDPKVDTQVTVGEQVGGERRYAFLVIPERGGKLTIPPHELHFFDPAVGAYQTAKTAPIELAVEGDPGATPATDAPAAAQPPPEAAEAEGILAPIVTPDALPRATPTESWLTLERFAWAMAGVPAVLALGTGGKALWRRFGPDDASRAAAARAARQRDLMARAEQGVATGDGFYPALAQLLHASAVERAGPEGEGLPRDSLLQLLQRKGVPQADCARLRDLLDRCDAARFGARAETPADRQAALSTARDLLRAPSLARPNT